MTVRTAARALAAGRLLVGLGLLLAPASSIGAWLGHGGGVPAARTMARALGAREIAIGAGILAALARGRPDEARRWLAAGIAGDAMDGALTAGLEAGAAHRRLIVALPVGGAVAGAVIRARLN